MRTCARKQVADEGMCTRMCRLQPIPILFRSYQNYQLFLSSFPHPGTAQCSVHIIYFLAMAVAQAPMPPVPIWEEDGPVAGRGLQPGDAKAATGPLMWQNLPAPKIEKEPRGRATPEDLPLKVGPLGDKEMLKWFVDIIINLPGPFSEYTLKSIEGACVGSRFHDLPVPFCLKESPKQGHKLQFALIKQLDGQYALVKHVVLEEQAKGAFVKRLCHGECSAVLFGRGGAKATKKEFQYVFEHFGGFQCVSFGLGASGGCSKVVVDCDDLETGFNYIEEHGPRSNTKNKQLKWVQKNIHAMSESPIYGWSEKLVEKALQNLMNDGALAATVEFFPMTLKDLDSRFLEMLKSVMSTLREKALGFHGEAGQGKTPAARIIAMAMSRYWTRKTGGTALPSFRTASEFDFFRGEVGHVCRPDIYDDGSLIEQPMKKVKAFTDVGNIEAMVMARWTAAKWVIGQLRIWAVNDFDASKEPADKDPLAGIQFVSHAEFMAMIDCAWHKDSNPAHVDAVIKRTVLVINSQLWWYFRPAGEQHVDVRRMRLETKTDFLTIPAREVYAKLRKNDTELPIDLEAALAWEEQWMDKAMDGKGNYPTAPGPVVGGFVLPDALPAAPIADFHQDGSAATDAACYPFEAIPQKHVARRLRAQLKRELSDARADGHRLLMHEARGVAIEVDSPEKRLRVGATSEEVLQFDQDLSKWKDGLLQSLAAQAVGDSPGQVVDADAHAGHRPGPVVDLEPHTESESVWLRELHGPGFDLSIPSAPDHSALEAMAYMEEWMGAEEAMQEHVDPYAEGDVFGFGGELDGF